MCIGSYIKHQHSCSIFVLYVFPSEPITLAIDVNAGHPSSKSFKMHHKHKPNPSILKSSLMVSSSSLVANGHGINFGSHSGTSGKLSHLSIDLRYLPLHFQCHKCVCLFTGALKAQSQNSSRSLISNAQTPGADPSHNEYLRTQSLSDRSKMDDSFTVRHPSSHNDLQFLCGKAQKPMHGIMRC